MKRFKGICSILLGLTLIFGVFMSTPVFAEGEEEGGTSEEQGGNEGGEQGGGEEWSGEITDPTPAPIPEPTPTPVTPTPTPVVTPTTPNVPTRKTTTPVDNPVVETEPEVTEVVEETEVETEVEPEVQVIEQRIVYPVITEMPEVKVPETAKPNNTKKVSLIVVIIAGIATFVSILVWTLVKLSKIKKFEKIYKQAISKSAAMKKARITRAAN